MSLMTISAPVVSTPVVTESSQPIVTYGGVPMSMIEYFTLDPRKVSDDEKTQMKDIYEHFARDGKSEGDVWYSIAELERKSGFPINEGRIAKLHRWVKINEQVASLEKQREALYARR